MVVALNASMVGFSLAVARIGRLEADVQAAAVLGVERATLAGQGIVRGNASGRPGPNVISGGFRRSISGEVVSVTPERVEGHIFSNAAQALRLENGYVGPDRLGRVFNQPPYPSFIPSVPEVERQAVALVTAALRAVGR